VKGVRGTFPVGLSRVKGMRGTRECERGRQLLAAAGFASFDFFASFAGPVSLFLASGLDELSEDLESEEEESEDPESPLAVEPSAELDPSALAAFSRWRLRVP
jgi:hypothetical protein